MENWLVQGLAVFVISSIVTSLAKWAYAKAGFWNEKLGLAMNRAELRKVQHLALEKSNLLQFLLTQLLWCFCFLAIALMFAPLAYATGGLPWLGAVVTLGALAIYGCVIFPLGMVVRLRKGDSYIQRQMARIERGEKFFETRRSSHRSSDDSTT
ncbi:TPA: hypothetical protein UOC34_001046 [Stenotrophomonas maltophilia]|uniref:hypothetical protein n=1 Tax=Stenotrophomonas maltophilia TaxID=40324 RepID=UPI000B515AD2|nr:hypothetical protein [Stenotrophomonas maltophilia]ASE52676.1 hypothetical protein CEQ03_07905 [Stenotrophomonas maltophilia]HDS1649308.1 hypothetical protein [Stenotrophomonas maltophilia]HEL4829679.1 hypothetical protein [Stenotrophomonas maltophilia]HEL5082872.1 hypothetical protein [Stenotrophomonas maltophilia]HEL5364095.1 hypothetical protein [Stenotrophomonas maltophilia]